MKKLIYFNAVGCPENIGQSQLVDDVQVFINERIDLLPNARIEGNQLIFNGGFAVIIDVPNDFVN